MTFRRLASTVLGTNIVTVRTVVLEKFSRNTRTSLDIVVGVRDPEASRSSLTIAMLRAFSFFLKLRFRKKEKSAPNGI